MESPLFFVLILATITFKTAPVYSQSIYASENPLPVGSNVTLMSNSSVTMGAWLFNNNIIVMIVPGNTLIADAWTDRVTYNSTTSSLTIRYLQVADSGKYTLQDINSFPAELTLSVQVPISNVSLEANETNLVEFNDTAVFMCSVSNGSSLSYVWLNGSSVVTTREGVQLSDGGARLTVVGVTRYDKGPFRCNVSNGISNEISVSVLLNISYGPSNPKMMMMPMKDFHRTGSNITLSCSAESNPAAMIQWMMNGSYINNLGSQLELEMVTESDSGNYKCLFYNTVTSRFTSASAVIMIMAPIAAVVVNHTGGPAILNESFTLHCEVTGTVDNIHWWRNGELISADNTTILDMSNNTLTLNPVQQSDNGDYQCQAFNSVSNLTSSSYTLKVNYGPMKPVITGPSMALTGTLVILNCSSASYPPSYISWYFNDSLVANTSELAIGPMEFNMSGKYICMAFNNITNKNSSAYMMLTVLDPVTMASIKAVGPQPIQNHTFTLTCETAGNVETIIWMNGWSPVYADNTRNLSMDNATLSFDPVMRSDDGPYRCVASNPLNNVTSEIFMLDVSYGPEMPTIMGPDVAKIGDQITLSCNASSNPPSTYKWFFDYNLVANTSEYITLPLTKNMSGMYTCMAFNNVTGKNSSANTMLTVVDPAEDMQVEAPMYPAIEDHFYNLTCIVTGPAEHIYWLKNGQQLHEDNSTVFLMGNKTVTFNPIEYNDTGNYQCMVIISDWNMTSPPYQLLVNFGPETPIINGPAFAEAGHIAVFNCSAQSVPPSQFSWWFNGLEVSNTSVFTTGPLSVNMTGEYTCMAYNNVTERNSTNSKMLTVIGAIKSVMIRNNTVPINNDNFALTCEVTGHYNMIYWTKDNQSLTGNHYHTENNTLNFIPVTTSNEGVYQCVASNQVDSFASPPYLLLVNYGPLHVTILGPDSAKVGTSVSLRCTADSQPDCDFYWFFNNQSSVLEAGPVVTFRVTKESEGDYKCEASNPVTNITLYQTKAFTVDHASTLHMPSHGALMLLGLFALSVTVLFN